MTSDFRFKNPITGGVQSIAGAFNYVLAARGQIITTTKPTSVAPSYYVSTRTLSRAVLTGSYLLPMIAFRCGSHCWVVPSGNTPSMTGLTTRQWTFWVDAAPGAIVYYWIFDLPANGMLLHTSNFAFQTYSAGQLAFSTRMAPLKIRGQGSSTVDNGHTDSVTYPAGYSYAAAPYVDYVGQSRSNNVYWNEGVGLKWVNSTLSTDHVQTTGKISIGNNLYVVSSRSDWLVVDVTNL